MENKLSKGVIPMLNFDDIDQAEYNRISAAYANQDDITQKLNETADIVTEIFEDLTGEYQKMKANNPGFLKTKFDLREHILRTIDLRIKIINDTKTHRKDIASSALKLKADVMKRMSDTEDEGELSGSDAAALVNSTKDILRNIDGEAEDAAYTMMEDEINAQEKDGTIVYSDGELLMMIPESSDFFFDEDTSEFTCVKEDGDIDESVDKNLFPNLEDFTKKDGELNIINKEIVNVNDDTIRYYLSTD